MTDFNFPDVEAERLAAINGGALFEAHQCKTPEDVLGVVKDADVVVVQFAPVNAEAVAAAAPAARFIRYGVGYNNIDVSAVRERGGDVAFVPDYCTDEVADHTVALALALVRGVVWLDNDVRSLKWDVVKSAPATRCLKTMRAGLVGLGRIGQATAARLAGFGFEVVAFDPQLDDDEAKRLDVRKVSEDELFATADLVVLHTPLTADTHHLVSARRFSEMKDGAFLVNASRGGLIDEDALADALHRGRLAGAALDVFEHEPLPPGSPLRQAPRLVLSPHAAWYSTDALERLQSLTADEISRALSGTPPRRRVPD